MMTFLTFLNPHMWVFQLCNYTKQLLLALLLLVFVAATVLHISYISKYGIDLKAVKEMRGLNSTKLMKSTKSSTNSASASVASKIFMREDDVTVVTAYFDIGIFGKGKARNKCTPGVYHKWMEVFAKLESCVVAYFDNAKNLDLFRRIRSRLPANMTFAILINRDQMWSFAMTTKIAAIFSKPNYPKYYPDTVVPLYSAAMHAKYEVTHRTISENPFRTKYFCWLDIGPFRQYAEDAQRNQNGSLFSLYLPSNYSKDSVAYQEVFKRDPNATAEQIISGDMVWVCGCFFIGSAQAVYFWTAEYKEVVERLVYLDELMASDQQVIYAAYNSATPPLTTIQTYRGGGNEWFGLGYLSREAGMKRMETYRLNIRTNHSVATVQSQRLIRR